jgi:hypothetical protein
MKSLIIQFVYLQFLDLLTTLAFLSHGEREMNPLVARMLQAHPVWGLLAVKIFAIGLAVYCLAARRHRLLGRANLFYAVLIAWNIVAIIAGGSFATARDKLASGTEIRQASPGVFRKL